MKTETNPRHEPWAIDDSEFYELETREDELAFLLRYAVLAPSGHNSQPWSFAIVPDGIEVFADYSRRLPHVDPADRELLMSVGAAILNLRVAAAHFGFDSTVLASRGAMDTAAVALVSLRETCDANPALRRLFPAILRRRTNRQPFDGEPIDAEAAFSLCDVADEHPDFVQFVLPRDKVRIAELVAEGDRMQREDAAVREELADWVRPARTGAGDGDASLVGTTPLLVVITSEDDPASLLEAGQVLEQLLLTVTLAGLQYSFMNQPVQVATLRAFLAPLGRSPHLPQLLLRIGYAPPAAQATPRRDVAEVIRA